MDPKWLKVKTAGLPRWAWIALFGSAVAVGLYLRSRNTEETEPEEEQEIDPEETGLSTYDGTETAGGLGSVGLAGPAQGQITPVEAPFIPDGVWDLLGQQHTDNVEAQQGIIALAQDALAREPSERVETVVERAPVESSQGEGGRKHREAKGGGAPKRKPHHKAPKKHKGKKPPRAKKPPRNKPPRAKKPPRNKPVRQRGGAGGRKPARHHVTRHR